MSLACPTAALAKRRLGWRGWRSRDVRSWLTKQSAALPSATVEVCAVGPSVEAQTVAAEAGPAPAATVARRRRGNALLWNQVRICLPYRVDEYPLFSPSTYVLVRQVPRAKGRGSGRWPHAAPA